MSTAIHQVQSERFTLNAALIEQIDRLAGLMASAGPAVPAHLRENKGACFAIAMQSLRWEMDPYMVASKTHITKSGLIGYDGQLVAAVVIARAPIIARPDYDYLGDWSRVLGKFEQRKSDKGGEYAVATYTKKDEEGLGVIVGATFRGETDPRTVQVMMAQAHPRFSTQWATDPQQQIGYLAVRKWARRHAPDVLLGVYTPEELDFDPGPRNMGTVDEVPRVLPSASRTDSVKQNLKKNAATRSVLLDDVLHQIHDASNADELAAAGELAGKLRTDREKEIARTAYADRLNAARTAAHQAAKKDDAAPSSGEPPVMTYAQVMDALQAATTPDALDEAATLIGAVPVEGQRSELEETYTYRRKQFEGQ
ncbi:hypothetical protein OKW45_001994 [Paraburkholderia sp. WSM4175]|uniref:RecT family recombinase n=1 Tax=Paraburkholderia sp. WSM4175 TaxID=2991072 RepID=UPI003D228AEA